MNYIFFFRLIIPLTDKGTVLCLVGLAPDLRDILISDTSKFLGMTTWLNSGSYISAEPREGWGRLGEEFSSPLNAPPSTALMARSSLSALYPV